MDFLRFLLRFFRDRDQPDVNSSLPDEHQTAPPEQLVASDIHQGTGQLIDSPHHRTPAGRINTRP